MALKTANGTNTKSIVCFFLWKTRPQEAGVQADSEPERTCENSVRKRPRVFPFFGSVPKIGKNNTVIFFTNYTCLYFSSTES